jgi:tRNA-splicing ligase RtcB
MEKPERKDLIKISDYIWEIPKSFREDMKVPARIFADEKMLDDILEDKSLWQLVNVASLPGIYKYALAMPDIHEGYGMCLAKDAKILTEYGYFVEMKDLEKFLPEIQILSFDKNKKILNKTKVIKFFKLKPYGKILRITTKAGFIIEATEDHPIFTPQGMKESKSLMIGDKVAVYGFEGVPYEKPSSNVIVDEEKIKKTFYKIKAPKEKSSLEIIIKKLKERNLLPLTYDNPKFLYLIKICAFIFGDGSMNFIGKKRDGILHFSGKKEDLLEIKKDLEKIGYTSSKIFKRKYVYKNGKISYIDNFYVNASSLLVLLAALGVPLGKKVNQKYNVPKWLFRAPLWQKRLFLAVLFGCELRKPHRRKERKFGFNAPVFTMNKRIDLIENGKKFLKDIAKLCQEFGVKTTKIQCRRLIVSKNGNKTKALELVFSSSLESLLNLWSKIGYEYNQERKTLASLYTIYLKHKKRNLEKRKEILNLIPSFFDQNLSYAKIAESLKSSGFTKRLILDFCYRIKNGYSYKKPKIPQNFITLKEFIKQNSLGKSGLCFDEIEKIEEIEYKDLVYDLTTLSKAHNFIANNFLVSNCVGGIAAFDYDEGIISPGICGYDINCGVRLAVTDLDYEEVKDKISKLTEEIFKQVPSGVGRGGFWKLNNDEMKKVLENGTQYIFELGYGEKEDLSATESFGKLEGADAEAVSKTAKDRGRDQLGTMGAGNHFVEVQRAQEIYNEEIAKKLGLEKGKIAVLIHCGSRGLGHQVATDYIRQALNYIDKQNIELPDRELAYFPYHHLEGQNYLSAMKASANFAFANRQLILHQVRKAFKKVFGKEIKLKQVYDVAHNIVKIEEYEGKKLIVHRKGATRAFWKGHPELAPKYKEIGQPTLIPGSMGTSSYILIGQELAKEISFGSAPHGAGRLMSRAEAKRKVKGSELKKELEKRGIAVAAGSMSGLAEEAPVAYKDVSEVVEVVHNIGIAKKLAKLVPVGVIKG